MRLLHLPFRAHAEILKRGLNYEPPRAMVRYNRGTSSQSAFFGEACTNDKIDVVGAAYSYNSKGSDRRLRQAARRDGRSPASQNSN